MTGIIKFMKYFENRSALASCFKLETPKIETLDVIKLSPLKFFDIARDGKLKTSYTLSRKPQTLWREDPLAFIIRDMNENTARVLLPAWH